MRIRVLFFAGLLASFSAVAAESAAFDGGTIVLGDRVGKVIDVAGEPDDIVQLPREEGEAAKQQFSYLRNGVLIRLTLSGGVVVAID